MCDKLYVINDETLYTGQAPECFFHWNDEISELRRRISDLHVELDYLIVEYFNNTDEEFIMMEIDQLLDDLEQANDTLNSINLQESSVEELQQMIINVSAHNYYK